MKVYVVITTTSISYNCYVYESLEDAKKKFKELYETELKRLTHPGSEDDDPDDYDYEVKTIVSRNGSNAIIYGADGEEYWFSVNEQEVIPKVA